MEKHHGACPLRGQFKIVWNGVEGSKPHPSPPPLSSRAFCLSITSISTHSKYFLFNPLSPRNVTLCLKVLLLSPISSGMNYKSVESRPKTRQPQRLSAAQITNDPPTPLHSTSNISPADLTNCTSG